MEQPAIFSEHMRANLERLSPAERRVAQFFRDHREEVLIASASRLAKKTATSDATVIRTAKALGFAGMEELRRSLARELRDNLSPAARLAQTVSTAGTNPAGVLSATLDIHQQSLEALRRDVSPAQFDAVVQHIIAADRVFIFGIGPSSAMADYFTIQLGRFGVVAHALTHTGLLLADGLQRLRRRDLLMIFAYSRVYPELAALLDHAERLGVKKILFSDTLGPKLHTRVDLSLAVARGCVDMLSMHTATLGLIEALLVGLATRRPAETVASLKSLNALRVGLVGAPMDLPAAKSSA